LEHSSRINRGLGILSVFALMLVSLVVGFLLARFNVFAASVATAICAVSSLIYVAISDPTPAQVLLTLLAPAFALQVGYLIGQFLWRPRNEKDRRH
jgi:ABC-type arginine/histidine transport system permease subunit